MPTAIPIIGQNVGVPSFDAPANPFHAEPIESHIGDALGDAGKQLMDIWSVQEDHKNALATLDRTSDFQGKLGQLRVDLLNSGMSAKEMTANFQTSSKGLIDAYVNNPDNAAISKQLAVDLRGQFGREMQSFPSEATVRVAKDLDFKAQQQVTQSAALAANEFEASRAPDGTPVFGTSAAGAQAIVDAHNTIDKIYDPASRATENAFYNNQFRHQLAVAQGQQVAIRNPTLVQDYIKHAASSGQPLTPEEQIGMLTQASATIARPMAQINAANEATRAQLLQKYDQQAQNGTLDMGQLTHDAQHNLITHEDFQRYAGIPLAEPSDPGALAAAKDLIGKTSTVEDLDTLRVGLLGNPNIRGRTQSR